MMRFFGLGTLRVLAAFSALWSCTPIAAADLPDIQQAVQTEAEASNDVAVLIGIEDYAFLPEVPFALRDVQAFQQFLVHTRGVPAQRVHILDSNPTAEKIVEVVEEALAEVNAGGTFWFYFSGHGAASTVDGRRLLLGLDTLPEAQSFEQRSVAVADLEALAIGSAADNVLVVLDTCYTGVGRDGEELLAGHRFAVPNAAIQAHERVMEWSATSASETSAPYAPVEQGLFTYFLLGALRGWADGEISGTPDDRVTLEEARIYVDRALRTVSGSTQRPRLDHTAAWGEYTLADSATESGPDLASVPRLTVASSAPTGLAESVAVVAQKTHEYQSQARSDWKTIEAITRGGGPEGRVLLQEFLARYGDAQIAVAGKSYPVDVEELDQARVVLDSYDVYWKKRRQRKAGTALLVVGSVAAAAGAAIAVGFAVEGQSAGKSYEVDWYNSWIAGGGITAGAGGAIVVVGVVNLGQAGRKPPPVAFLPGPFTVVTLEF